MEDYKQVRDNLISMLEELDCRLGDISEESAVLNEVSEPQLLEVIVDAEQQTEEDSSRIEMEKIQQAIKRIDSKTYGICLRCGQPIPKECLKAVPVLGYCHHCKEKP